MVKEEIFKNVSEVERTGMSANCLKTRAEAYPWYLQTFKMEGFATLVNAV